MGLDNIIVLGFILGAIGALVVVNLRSRHKGRQAKSHPENGE
jgi:hypothetical protein